MLDSFEKESRLHERRLARQRQMRLMEEAASGLPLHVNDDDDDDNANNNEMEYEMPPPSHVEEVDSEDDVPSMYSGIHNSNNLNKNGNDNLWSSANSKDLDDSKLKFVMGDNTNNNSNNNYDETASYSSWTERQKREHDESRHLIMLASRRVSSSSGRGGTLEMEMRDEERRSRRYNKCPVWFMLHRKLICSLCLVMALIVMGVLIGQMKKNMGQDGAEWPMNPATGGSSSSGMTSGTSASHEPMDSSNEESTHNPQDSSNNNNDSSSNNNQHELDMIKFERIKDRLLEHQISHASTLEDPTTAQYKALQWIVRDDPRQLDVMPLDDVETGLTGEQVDREEGLFERYALAVFWFQTTDLAIVNGGSGGGSRNGGPDRPFRTEEEEEDEVEFTMQEIQWRESTNWLTEKGFCLWHGVICHPVPQSTAHGASSVRYDDDFHVAILNLTENNIHGLVPREVYMAFTKMQALDLSWNELGGAIGREIGALRDLQGDSTRLFFHVHLDHPNMHRADLFLQSNQFTGAIPTTIGELGNLYNLNISDNKIAGTVPTQIGMMSKLRDASMFQNRIGGRIPGEIGYLTASSPHWSSSLFFGSKHLDLLALYLDSNRLTGPIPTSIGKLTSLVDLRLRANKLTGTIPSEVGELKNLETLYLDTNRGITGKIPTELANLVKATEIQLYQNSLTGPLPSELGLLDGLIFLYLDSNELTGSIPEEWGGMRNLEQLFLSGNNLQGQIPDTIRGMEVLQYLRASDNQFSGTIPTDMGKMLKLEFLYLEENDFDGLIPSELGELHKLQLLKLDGNNLSGQMPSEICKLRTSFFLVNLTASNNDESFFCACCTNY
ncbi:hypothetical protein HJC23_001269 [Cyclotella cryptica]|uniref:L domain-like protein n=1 Tax=Cyclotella cryptica TaxID=29204 RepID=A0ABD3PDT3_9STRA